MTSIITEHELNCKDHIPDPNTVEETGEYRQPKEGEYFFCEFCLNVERCCFPNVCMPSRIYKKKEKND